MENVGMNKSRSSKVLSIVIKSMSTLVPSESGSKNKSQITRGKPNNRANKYFPDEYFYYAYRI